MTMTDKLQTSAEILAEGYRKDGIRPPTSEGLPKLKVVQAGQTSALDRLKSLSATNRITEMEANMSSTEFVFTDLALSGQVTLFYAPPNAGKTLLFLRLLIDAIQSNRVRAENIFYINADDSYGGLLDKAKISRHHGFAMISPAEANISPNDVLAMLHDIAITDRIDNKIIVMDTLKKFVDMMSKRAQSDLYAALRVLVTKGATVIIAGHVNKHLDHNGELIYEGTSDTLNDIDCAYAVYPLSEEGAETQVIELRRKKNRGDNIAKVSYRYTKRIGMTYQEIVDSVEILNPNEARKASAIHHCEEMRSKYESEILFVRDLLSDGKKMNQTKILDSRKGHVLAGEISDRSIRGALKDLIGIEWSVIRGDRNASVFSLVVDTEAGYRKAKGV